MHIQKKDSLKPKRIVNSESRFPQKPCQVPELLKPFTPKQITLADEFNQIAKIETAVNADTGPANDLWRCFAD